MRRRDNNVGRLQPYQAIFLLFRVYSTIFILTENSLFISEATVYTILIKFLIKY